MANYLVTWTIELEADSPIEAAEQALAIHRDPESIATCFMVSNTDDGDLRYVDLQEEN